MKIVFVGGGTGGHFYPLISVAEEIGKYAIENQLIQPKMYYFGPNEYDEKALYETGMSYVYSSAGKKRRTKDLLSRLKNFFSFFQIVIGVLKSLISLYFIFPDVIFSKGGYTTFPVLMAGKILRIPIVIHESDASFGRVNMWAKSFAKYIATSYPETEIGLTEKERKKSALVGVPIRKNLMFNPLNEAYKVLRIDPKIPTIAVLGGSLGAMYVNNAIIDTLPTLLKKYQIVHVTGKANYKNLKKETDSFLRNLQGLNKYVPIDFLNAYNLRALYTSADVIITRAGSGTLFEIAEWGIPSIIIPIVEEVSHDQKKNAYAYSRSAGGIVIEEKNFTPSIIEAEIDKILSNTEYKKNLKNKAKLFSTPKASRKIANLLVAILKDHEV